jgi:hypothetical protein
VEGNSFLSIFYKACRIYLDANFVKKIVKGKQKKLTRKTAWPISMLFAFVGKHLKIWKNTKETAKNTIYLPNRTPSHRLPTYPSLVVR